MSETAHYLVQEPWLSLMLLIGRVCLAMVFLVSGVHKGIYYSKAIDEFRQDRIPFIPVTLPGTIGLHLAASLGLITGLFVQECAIALALFTLIATFKVHGYWKFSGNERLNHSRIMLDHVGIIGGLIIVAVVGPGSFTL